MEDNTFKTFQSNGLVQCYKDYKPKYVIAGDTDSSYIDLADVFDRDAPVDDVVEFADDIGTQVNDSFHTFMKDIFNVPDDRKGIIKTDREVVSDKSYFLAKKMYVMHVVNKEGKETDELKMMGVAIKKTDTPTVVQDMLKGLVEMLMDKCSFEDVSDYIDKFKEDYHKMSMMDIGKPIAVKSFTKYEVKYKKTGSLKGVPYHIRASLIYNDMCSSSDRLITSSDKVRLCYINHPRFKYIALPVDVEVHPKFTEALIIDWNAQWETVMKKVNIFLKPIHYDRDGRQTKLIKSLLRY